MRITTFLLTQTTEIGRTYNLSDDAITRLREAVTADIAEIAFNDLASHVPKRDRVGIWFAVDNIQHLPFLIPKN